MSNVSSWSPIDENNNAPPPDGWPEFMMPSQVNNSARALMGAVRRMYDQMIAGTLGLPYVPIAGNVTITGGLTINGALVGGSITSNSTLYSASTISTGGAVNAAGNVSGASISTGGPISGNTVTANSMQVNAQINASYYDMGGLHLAFPAGGQTLLYDRANNWCVNLDSGGNNTYANGTHWFGNRGNSINYGRWDSGGLTVAVGGIYGGFISSSGNVNAAGAFTGGSVSVGGSISGGWYYSSGIQFGNNGNEFWADRNIRAAGAITAGAHLGSDNGNLYLGGLHVYNNSSRWHFDQDVYSAQWIMAGGNTFAFGWGAVNGTISSDGGTFYTNRQLNVSGQVWVGQTHLQDNGIQYFNTGVVIGFQHDGGSGYPSTHVYYNGGYVYTIASSSSDERIKKNIARSELDALGLVRQIDTIAYDMHGRHHAVGVRGQQLAELMPDTVHLGPADAEIPELIQVNPLALSTYLLRALQQLAAKVDQLEAAGGDHE